MVWVYLTAAIATEVARTVALKFTDGFTRPSIALIVVGVIGVNLAGGL